MEILVIFVILSLCAMFFGVQIMRRALRSDPELPAPPVPPAYIANPNGDDRVMRTVTPRSPKALRAVAFTFGLALFSSPVVFMAVVMHALRGMGSGSKGRVLRIKDRAQLAEPALGDGWSDEAPETAALAAEARTLAPAARAALGEIWLLTSRMEHASVAAFSQLSLHLTTLAAPARLLAATHQAALEEIRHARACFAVARAITGQPHTAGAIPALGARDGGIDLPRLAIGSLIDGCLAEGIAADVAGHSAARAEHPTIKAVLSMIARDEAGHAELAWDVLAWCLTRDASLHAIVAARVAVLDRELVPRLPDIPGASPPTLGRYGVIDQDALGAIAAARVAAVQVRARALLAPPLALAA
jgi:hypothetical protein